VHPQPVRNEPDAPTADAMQLLSTIIRITGMGEIECLSNDNAKVAGYFMFMQLADFLTTRIFDKTCGHCAPPGSLTAAPEAQCSELLPREAGN